MEALEYNSDHFRRVVGLNSTEKTDCVTMLLLVFGPELIDMQKFPAGIHQVSPLQKGTQPYRKSKLR